MKATIPTSRGDVTIGDSYKGVIGIKIKDIYFEIDAKELLETIKAVYALSVAK